jgi:hypothetical protein
VRRVTVYRVEVSGPEPCSADELALMLTSDDHYRTSDYVITVTAEKELSWGERFDELMSVDQTKINFICLPDDDE